MVCFITPSLWTDKSVSSIWVTNRSGKQEILDISKIREVVEWAIADLDVNPLELEANFHSRLNTGISTSEIQDNLREIATSLCSIDAPDWRYVAGRLQVWSKNKEVVILRQGENFVDFVQRKVAEGIYRKELTCYSISDLVEAQSWLIPERDKDYDLAGVVLLQKRYVSPDETIQENLLINSLILASQEEKANRLPFAKQLYEALSTRKLSLATPLMANLRFEGGSVTSCFITAMDDTIDSIFDEVKNIAKISKQGGGVGVNLSRVRAKNSSVMGNKNASGGIVPWVVILNSTLLAVNQGGRRAGAGTISLDVWHLDIPEFLELQTENGDKRRKAYDVFPQVVIPDEFMRRVEEGKEWTLVDPYEVRQIFGYELAELWGESFTNAYLKIEANLDRLTLYQKVNARNLFKHIMQSQVETGMPYLAFKDTINETNPNQHAGYIPGVNLCCESWSNVSPGKEAHCCNLSSLNLANIEEDELESICRIAVRLLDNSIDITDAPFREAQVHNNKYRTIGVGAMGLADWLAKRDLTYASGIFQIDRLFEDIAYFCTSESNKLAQERGHYQAFSGSEWSKGNLLGAKPIEFFDECSDNPQRWHELRSNILHYGIRNSHITAIAPNTSSSLVQGCTASILPTFKKFFYDKWAKGVLPIAPPFIKDKKWFYPENITLDQKIVIDTTATIQKWIDTGISMELVFNLNNGIYFEDRPIKAPDIFQLLMRAWKSKVKAIYYIRTVQKDSFIENQNCTTCAN